MFCDNKCFCNDSKASERKLALCDSQWHDKCGYFSAIGVVLEVMIL